MIQPAPLDPPSDPHWMGRLRTGNQVWCTKEKQYAIVVWPWEPPEPGHTAGRVGLDLYFADGTGELHFTGQATWYVRPDGTGFDQKQLLQPCEGELADNPPPLPEPIIQRIYRAISSLGTKLAKLEETYGMSRHVGGVDLATGTSLTAYQSMLKRVPQTPVVMDPSIFGDGTGNDDDDDDDDADQSGNILLAQVAAALDEQYQPSDPADQDDDTPPDGGSFSDPVVLDDQAAPDVDVGESVAPVDTDTGSSDTYDAGSSSDTYEPSEATDSSDSSQPPSDDLS